VTRRRAYAVAAALCAAPRLAVLFHERDSITAAFTEKSDVFAQVFVQHGTFGLVPGEPSAYTQPLYGWFLVPVYWIFGRSWLSIGLAQIVVAIATALLVYEIGRRVLGARAGLAAAAIATLNPYLVWHDVHVNREIVDQTCAAALVLLTLLVVERRSVRLGLLLGVAGGLAMLGNSRLVFLPILLAAYLAWRLPRAGATAIR
jgi:4-amino-4-deoxy-L-arabinose transferase-like glycosyltransferase